MEELIGKLSFIDKDVSLQEVVLLNVLFRRLVSVEQAIWYLRLNVSTEMSLLGAYECKTKF